MKLPGNAIANSSTSSPRPFAANPSTSPSAILRRIGSYAVSRRSESALVTRARCWVCAGGSVADVVPQLARLRSIVDGTYYYVLRDFERAAKGAAAMLDAHYPVGACYATWLLLSGRVSRSEGRQRVRERMKLPVTRSSHPSPATLPRSTP